MSENVNKSVILLSGGLDSIVSLGLGKKKYNISLALTFDYGQKAVNKEFCAAKKYCDYYNVEHKVIKLDWLKEITKASLVSEAEITESENVNNLWIPNRNGLFLNIAASFCDANGYDTIIIGANLEEAKNFPDNTKDFIERANSLFEFSTLIKPKVVAPLIDCDKAEIVKLAIKNDIPLSMLYSCYKNGEKHCGKCPSCVKLKSALLKNNANEYISQLFEG